MAQSKAQNISIFQGEDQVQLQRYIMGWKKAFEGKYGEYNISTIERPYEQYDELCSIIDSRPLFGEKRLLIIDGLFDTPDTDAIKARQDQILDHLAGIDETLVVLVKAVKPDKRKKFYKTLLQISTVKDFTLSVDHLSEAISQAGLNEVVSKRDRGYLLERLVSVGGNARQEIAKLALYAHDLGGMITRKDIDALMPPTAVEEGFALLRALSEGPKRVQYIVEILLANNEDIHRLIGLLTWQLDSLTRLWDSMNKEPESAWASSTGLKPYTIKTLKTLARGMNKKRLTRGYKKVLDFDEQLKNGVLKGEKESELALMALLSDLSITLF